MKAEQFLTRIGRNAISLLPKLPNLMAAAGKSELQKLQTKPSLRKWVLTNLHRHQQGLQLVNIKIPKRKEAWKKAREETNRIRKQKLGL